MYKRRNNKRNKKTAEDSQHWSIYGKPKKKGKYEVVFDEESRKDYLTGFQARKVERRKKAVVQQKVKEKEIRTQEKQQRKAHIEKAIKEMSGQGELEDALKDMLPVEEDDDVESGEDVEAVFAANEANNASETVVQYNAPGVVVTAITSAVFDEEEKKAEKPVVREKTAVKAKPVQAATTPAVTKTKGGESEKKSKSEIKKINTNKKRKHPTGGHKQKSKHPNKKFKKN